MQAVVPKRSAEARFEYQYDWVLFDGCNMKESLTKNIRWAFLRELKLYPG